MINELNIFNGPFKDILPKFINYQRAQGYDYLFFRKYIRNKIRSEFHFIWVNINIMISFIN